MSIFSKIFGSTRSKIPANLAALKCDVHSHLIPGIDDGAQTMGDSIALIKEFQKLGYKKIITTPHILTDGYRNTPEIILSGLEKVRAALKTEGVAMELHAAAEYYLDYDFERKLDNKELLTFGDNYLLFEVSFLYPPDNLNDIIFKLLTSGYKPILAHPERYNFWHSKFSKYEELKEKGVLLQLNINSLTGHYSPETKKVAEMLIEKNMIDLLGSDCHNINHIKLINSSALYENALHTLINSGKLLNPTL